MPTRLILTAALLCSALAAHAQILQNGSFEQPAIGDGTLQAVTPTGWSGGALLMNPLAGGAIPGNVFLWPQAADGTQFEDIGNTATFALSQTFAIASSQAYAIEWQDNVGGVPALPGFQTAPYAVSLLDDAAQTIFSVSLDSYHADGQWVARTLTPTLAAGSYTLTFTSLNLPNRTDTLIDAVSVSPAGAVTPVPEPATAWLIAAGLAALAWRRRRAT